MEEFLKFLIKNVTGLENFSIETLNSEDGFITFIVKLPKDSAGLLIGKEGKTIKAIVRLLKVKATLEKKRVNVEVSPEE